MMKSVDAFASFCNKWVSDINFQEKVSSKAFTRAPICIADEGLRERTPAMCQIPTYVTRIANGKEKVNAINDLAKAKEF